MIRVLVFAILLAVPGAVLAQASVCAALPEAGAVGEKVADVMVMPVPRGDRGVQCPDDFSLDVRGRMPMCTGPGVKAVDGNPRAMCYAALPLGPLAALKPHSRPTRTCPAATTAAIIRLEGTNAGLSDVKVSVVPDDGITLVTLADAAAENPAENPVVQGCFGFRCRLVKLEITAKASAQVRLQMMLPGGEPVETQLKLPEYCPR